MSPLLATISQSYSDEIDHAKTDLSLTYGLYDRLAAYNYAQKYWDEVCSDGYFVNTRTTYIPLDPGTDITGMTGYDCAHFVSCCIGNEPHEPGGGLDVPNTAPHIYGELGATQLGDWLITSGKGVEKPTISDLMMGDVINYDWDGDGHWDHIALYLGSSKVTGHTTCVWEEDWQLIGATDYRFIHILGSPWTVDDDGSADFTTIQEAINEAYDGDIVFVRNGIYVENLIVNKSISLLGEDRENTVIDGDEVGTVVQVDSDNVTINGFEIRNCSMTWGDWGIDLNHSSKSVISKNIIKAVYAIRVKGGSENTVKDNDVVGYDGSCVFHGLQLVNSSSNVVNNNNLSVNCHSALTMYNSSNNFISFNYISGHFVPFPFTIEKSSNNSIAGNTMWQPAPLFGGHIHFTESNGNVLYHNSFLADGGPNTLFIDELSTNNTWDNGCEGNYWSNYTGNDTNGDGIGDTPNIIDGSNQDNFPLMNPYWNPADINYDSKVDIFDVVLAAGAYMATPSDFNWNCHCDIADPYGIINIFDIVLICSSYGETYTP